MKDRYGLTKKDFADMLKKGCVIDKDIIKEIETGLKNRYPDKKWVPMQKILKNVIEYANVDYTADIAYKIDLLGKFGIPFEDINGKFDFLKYTNSDLLTRLKLMNLTNELPHSFLSVGHISSNARVYKLFLKFVLYVLHFVLFYCTLFVLVLFILFQFLQIVFKFFSNFFSFSHFLLFLITQLAVSKIFFVDL